MKKIGYVTGILTILMLTGLCQGRAHYSIKVTFHDVAMGDYDCGMYDVNSNFELDGVSFVIPPADPNTTGYTDDAWYFEYNYLNMHTFYTFPPYGGDDGFQIITYGLVIVIYKTGYYEEYGVLVQNILEPNVYTSQYFNGGFSGPLTTQDIICYNGLIDFYLPDCSFGGTKYVAWNGYMTIQKCFDFVCFAEMAENWMSDDFESMDFDEWMNCWMEYLQ